MVCVFTRSRYEDSNYVGFLGMWLIPGSRSL